MADKDADRFRGTPKGVAYCDTPGTYCWYNSQDVCVNCGRSKGWRSQPVLPNIDLPAVLDNIIVTAAQAKAALVDEHEGNLNKAVDQLMTDIRDVHTLVKNW